MGATDDHWIPSQPSGSTVAEGGDGGPSEFFIERAGDEWRLADGPAALYCVAVASKAPLPAVAASSTLADCGIELVRTKERAAAREKSRIEQEGEFERERDELSEEAGAKKDFSAALDRERAAHVRLMQEREDEVRAEHNRLAQRIRGADEDIARSERLVASNQQRMLEPQAHINFRRETTFIREPGEPTGRGVCDLADISETAKPAVSLDWR